MIKTIAQIEHVLYINLADRVDRNTHVIGQLHTIGLARIAKRFNAIKLRNGALGCSASHLKCLRHAFNAGWDHVLICEDDITFLNPELFMQQLNKCLTTNDDWDVIMLGGNNVPPHYRTKNDSCVKISKCFTTTGYLVKGTYFNTLIKNIQEGIQLFMSNISKPNLYAIDVYWEPLQTKDNWLLITPLTVVQKEGYSDIEEKDTNYNKCMLDLNKPYMGLRK
jgi:GR25 family glycosyltransferase involved in LPS biosynthesis